MQENVACFLPMAVSTSDISTGSVKLFKKLEADYSHYFNVNKTNHAKSYNLTNQCGFFLNDKV